MIIFWRSLALIIVVGLAVTGCSSMKPYMDSPQYDEASKRFQHPAGYRNDKGFFDLLGLAGAFFTREKDPAERDGFPLRDPAAQPPATDGTDVTWIGHASLLFRHGGISVLTDPVFYEGRPVV